MHISGGKKPQNVWFRPPRRSPKWGMMPPPDTFFWGGRPPQPPQFWGGPEHTDTSSISLGGLLGSDNSTVQHSAAGKCALGTSKSWILATSHEPFANHKAPSYFGGAENTECISFSGKLCATVRNAKQEKRLV